MFNATRRLIVGLILLAMLAGPLAGPAAAEDDPAPAPETTSTVEVTPPAGEDTTADVADEPEADDDAPPPTAAGDPAPDPAVPNPDLAADDGGQPEALAAAVNQAPVAVNDAFTIAEDATLTVAAPGLLANDSDPDGDAIEAGFREAPTHGTLNGLFEDGSFSYTPNRNFSGTDNFAYAAFDGAADSIIATVTIEVTPVNDPPEVLDRSFSATQGFSLVEAAPGVLATAFDEEGDPITALLVDGPAHGTVDLAADGGFTYTPEAGFAGPDSFTFQAFDGADTSPVATATIEVFTIPIAVADAYATSIDTPLTVDAANGVLANDIDPEGEPLIADLLQAPEHGSLDLRADGSFTYTPAAGFLGIDSFQYEPTDGKRFGKTVFVDITVGSAPVGMPDAYVTDRDTTLTVDAANGVLANDSDPNGLPLTALSTSTPKFGSLLSFAADGSFVYMPEPGFSGTDSFTYVPQNTGLGGEATTVTITVNPVQANTPPVAQDDSIIAIEDTALVVAAPGVLANDSDAEDDALTVQPGDGPAHGTLALNPDGSFTYTPGIGFVGTDAFTYQVADGQATSGPATVIVTVTAAEPVPTPTVEPTEDPTEEPTQTPTPAPPEEPSPTPVPTDVPTNEPTPDPNEGPTSEPSPTSPSDPTEEPSETPTAEPPATEAPTEEPTATDGPTETPAAEPSVTDEPTEEPTEEPIGTVVAGETETPAVEPTQPAAGGDDATKAEPTATTPTRLLPDTGVGAVAPGHAPNQRIPCLPSPPSSGSPPRGTQRAAGSAGSGAPRGEPPSRCRLLPIDDRTGTWLDPIARREPSPPSAWNGPALAGGSRASQSSIYVRPSGKATWTSIVSTI
jgi:hypothetical protein